MEKKYYSQDIIVFHGRTAPEKGFLVGYGALIEVFALDMPLPFKLALISTKNRQYKTAEWQVFTSRHQPAESLYKQLIFAIRYEGINLLFFKKLFEKLSISEIEELVQYEPLGQYSRKIWFLYEWLFKKQLNIQDLKSGNFVALIDDKLQYSIEGSNVARQRIVNNLPGTADFCPLIFKTEKLEHYIKSNFSTKKNDFLKDIRKDVLQRASAFLLLKDSKASFTIEGENPSNKRAQLWGKAIGQAGNKKLNKEELLRLQQMVIENTRFVKMGYRNEGGFVGEHDRINGYPIPEHISAKEQDIEELIEGLLQSFERMEMSNFDAVLVAAKVAFGFVFIHPFVDGNGRIHRYLIHHILAKMNFAQQGVIFPVSASILNHINDYRVVLESYSHPLLDFINWEKTKNNNVEVLNNTIDFYKYFDATPQAEFLYDCVNDTIKNIIPEEVNYLHKFDEMKYFLENTFEMPDNTVALLIRFLEQNQGLLSKRAQKNEFSELTANEILNIEKRYKEIFIND